MSTGTGSFIDELTGLSMGLDAARRDAFRGFAPEAAPEPVLLLALGHGLADELVQHGAGGSGAVLDAIDRALAAEDPDRHDAASAVIEAMVGRAVDAGSFADLRALLPEAIAAHAVGFVALDR